MESAGNLKPEPSPTRASLSKDLMEASVTPALLNCKPIIFKTQCHQMPLHPPPGVLAGSRPGTFPVKRERYITRTCPPKGHRAARSPDIRAVCLTASRHRRTVKKGLNLVSTLSLSQFVVLRNFFFFCQLKTTEQK